MNVIEATDEDRIRDDDSAADRLAAILDEGLPSEIHDDIEFLNAKFNLNGVDNFNTSCARSGSQTQDEMLGLAYPDFDIENHIDPSPNAVLNAEVANAVHIVDIPTTIQRNQKPVRSKVAKDHALKARNSSNREASNSGGPQTYSCEECGKQFNKKSNLIRHVRIHTGEKSYKCNVCSKSFVQSRYLHQHLLVHTAESPYKCEVCTKSFTRSISLQNHLQTHTDVKPYKCQMCNKSFTQDVTLRQHLRLHTGEQPYKCDMCSRSFALNSYLRKHLRTHTGERPYSCEICRSSFAQSSNLQRHLQTHTDRATSA